MKKVFPQPGRHGAVDLKVLSLFMRLQIDMLWVRLSVKHHSRLGKNQLH